MSALHPRTVPAGPARGAGSPSPGGWPAWRWAALLGFALLAPAALPAGGAERRLPDVRRRERLGEPLLSDGTTHLHCAPGREAPVLVRLEPGAPLRVLRQWLEPGGRRWLQVEASTGAGRASRGWLAG
ncbi:SH3 domain-containing protein [Synechococcus sp. CCY 9618]|uniref:SH3 domain-containing protein n=1 Tax=Synechococcus sp. CCY 9618 TaxID=2815602 RepID=UPI0020B3BE6B|nr:SH3 domain-containing protein [Synechococcus sp. CCY 9618]